MADLPPPSDPSTPRGRVRRWRRWLLLIVALVFFALVFREVLDPFGDDTYLEVPHGNHAHFVPKDRDPDVPIGAFPTQPPGPGERILPNGQVVRE